MSRTEFGSAKASRMNSGLCCSIMMSPGGSFGADGSGVPVGVVVVISRFLPIGASGEMVGGRRGRGLGLRGSLFSGDQGAGSAEAKEL